ncbi:sulfotransferase family 2 domain-containing protein [Neptuniibacter sp.]|uniref:sulfotransferase family 2 domain-containing protein n=1 Tax=Neptuniibacter sp. TaxID=1962643 RepID=UPI00261CA549|nr:sulfotransferase family 2 domain-containing protein [Neptuniibacter sp.]
MVTNELKVAFTHIPKTGGRSWKKLFREKFQRYKIMNSANAWQTNMPHDTVFGYYNLFIGHFGYDQIPLPRSFKYVTILREPVARTISQYNHFINMPSNMEVAAKMREEKPSLMEFIDNEDPNILFWVNAQTGYICSSLEMVDEEGKLVYDLRDMFFSACHNICQNYDSVGILERPEDTLKLFQHRYGIGGDLDTVGVTPKKYKVDVSKEDLEIIRDQLEPDIALYNLAGELLNEALFKEGLD